MERSGAIREEELLAQMGWVRALARSLLSDPGLADDVAQDAWLLAKERPPRERAGAGLRAWLSSVTRRLAKQSVRSSRRRSARERLAAKPEAATTDEEVVERGAMHERIVRAVMALEEPYRSTVLLRYLDGLSSAQIAARRGEPAALVRKRLERGLDRLRGLLDAEFGGDGTSWSVALLPLVTAKSGVLPVMKTTTTIGLLKLVAAVTLLAGATYTGWSVLSRRIGDVWIQDQDGHVLRASADDLVDSTLTATPNETRVAAETPVDGDSEQPVRAETVASLDKITSTFLTDNPEFEQLCISLDSLGREAVVDEESVVKKPRSGGVEGRVTFPGTSATARFELAQDQWVVSFEWGKETLKEPFFARDVKLAFHQETGLVARPNLYVQFHSLSSKPVEDFIAPGEEKRVGWGVSYGERGCSLQPLGMWRGPESGTWMIGNSKQLGRRDEPGIQIPPAFETWYRRLAPYAP